MSALLLTFAGGLYLGAGASIGVATTLERPPRFRRHWAREGAEASLLTLAWLPLLVGCKVDQEVRG